MTVKELIHKLMEYPLGWEIGLHISKDSEFGRRIVVAGKDTIQLTTPEEKNPNTVGEVVTLWIEGEITKEYETDNRAKTNKEKT